MNWKDKFLHDPYIGWGDYFVIGFGLFAYIFALYCIWVKSIPVLEKIFGSLIVTGFFGFLLFMHCILISCRFEYMKKPKQK